LRMCFELEEYYDKNIGTLESLLFCGLLPRARRSFTSR
jgi:hypothetical protein